MIRTFLENSKIRFRRVLVSVGQGTLRAERARAGIGSHAKILFTISQESQTFSLHDSQASEIA